MAGRLDGRRVLITQADDYMGPATAELFAAQVARGRAVGSYPIAEEEDVWAAIRQFFTREAAAEA